MYRSFKSIYRRKQRERDRNTTERIVNGLGRGVSHPCEIVIIVIIIMSHNSSSNKWGDKCLTNFSSLTETSSKESIQTFVKWIFFNRKHSSHFIAALQSHISSSSSSSSSTNSSSSSSLYAILLTVLHEVFILHHGITDKWEMASELRMAFGESLLLPHAKLFPPARLQQCLTQWDTHHAFETPTILRQLRNALLSSTSTTTTSTTDTTTNANTSSASTGTVIATGTATAATTTPSVPIASTDTTTTTQDPEDVIIPPNDRHHHNSSSTVKQVFSNPQADDTKVCTLYHVSIRKKIVASAIRIDHRSVYLR